MAEGAPSSTPAGMEDPPHPAPSAEPPPLDTIRVRGPGARGLNKPAILSAAGGGVAIVLLLASGAFSSGPSRKPSETKPMMSDPARPEMAQGAIRALPADYTEAAKRTPAPAPPAPYAPPELGPPMPGDIAAFAQADPPLRGRLPESGYYGNALGPEASDTTSDPLEDERDAAQRSGLFFALSQEADQRDTRSAEVDLTSPVLAPRPAATRPSKEVTDRTLFPGAIIPASLVTELNSEAPGPVIAQVTQAIYDSATGRIPLIPQGARLIGDYKSSTRYGQNRIAITWLRLIMPDGTERALDEPAVSPNGSAGVDGEVDNHWGDVFGAAALGTLINVGVATTEDPQINFSGVGAVSRDPVDHEIQDGVQRSASTVTNRVVDRGLAIPPTIRVQSGARISVIVTRRSTF